MVRESNGILGFKNPVFENPTRRVVLGFLGFIIFGLWTHTVVYPSVDLHNSGRAEK